MFGRKKRMTLGIDIQKNVVKYCTMRNGQWFYGEKLANGSFFKDNGIKNKEELKSVLQQIFSDVRMKNPEVTIAVLNSKVLIKQVPLQKRGTEKEIREFLFLELGESIALPFEKPIFDLLILDRPTHKKEKRVKTVKGSRNQLKKSQKITIKRNRFALNGKVPVVITSEPILEEIGEVIQKSGGQLVGVDCSSLAYTRIFKKNINWGENFILVELDSGEATITIFEKLVPVYVQCEDYNQANWRYHQKGKEIIAEYREDTELVALTELGMMIKNVSSYFESEISATSKLSKIYLVGGHPLLKKEVVESIQQQNELPVNVLPSPLKLKNQKRLPYRFLLAAGLSMKEVR